MSREEIVIVDDEQSVRDTLTSILDGEGYSCRTFESAKTALKHMEEVAPIAVFLDIRMPDMDGLEFLHEMRKSHSAIPVIVMTGYSDHEVFRSTLQYKIADFLPKPFEARVVRDALERVLGRDESFSDRFLETVTHRLREARIALGLKQSEVASRCGMSTSQVSQIELRQSSPSVTTLLKLCKALNLTITELVKGF
ncbi:Nitrogen assimilation regulatory protein [Planctomycetes bacterium Pan216]|uniref:Nitrogen assimilation regulatory protein n=1 Tax=Kolteria novifilia TaxID=2527975 RepID=A0A518BBW0_9BACT|nr:Nitrogen assimilation regulatory protein [Planctomycetes bacterium Pan216]